MGYNFSLFWVNCTKPFLPSVQSEKQVHNLELAKKVEQRDRRRLSAYRYLETIKHAQDSSPSRFPLSRAIIPLSTVSLFEMIIAKYHIQQHIQFQTWVSCDPLTSISQITPDPYFFFIILILILVFSDQYLLPAPGSSSWR